MGYKAIVNYKTHCGFTSDGRMIVNFHTPEGFITSEVKTLNFMYDVERNSFYIEVYTRNSKYLIQGVPHEAFVQLASQVQRLNLQVS